MSGRKTDAGPVLYLPQPNEKQRQFFLSRCRYTAYGGARGGGKTWAVRCKAIAGALHYPGIRILILRRTYNELEATLIQPTLDLLSGMEGGEGLYSYHAGSRSLRFANDLTTPKLPTVYMLANLFGVEPEWLMGAEAAPTIPDTFPVNPTRKIPLLGQIAAGLPIYAEENIEGYLWTDHNHGAEYFGLRVRGNSMNAVGIADGDIVIVRKQDIVEDGDIAVVLVDECATVKRYHREGETIILTPQSTDPANQVQLYSLKDHTVKVLGRVVENRKMF